ncbi:hypothetical protein YERSI8AC_180090 [Enterobacterales bacterium 8AC]|nr:hypothetical protein YERSI8AC_180090 [Enterobacterales bacterium 8AC]
MFVFDFHISVLRRYQCYLAGLVVGRLLGLGKDQGVTREELRLSG